jgi:flagellar biosynthesis/type III secretory pathway chaperone
MHHEATTTIDSRDAWESDIAGLLSELSAVQTDLLHVLTDKRTLLAAGDGAALGAIAIQEQGLVTRLQACHERRERLLAQAAGEGLPSDSIKSLSKSLPAGSRNRLRGELEETRERSRILQHESLTNWVLVQRTLVHLSQMIEIIATGGRMKPTYGKGSDRQDQGALVDRAV